VYVLFQIAINPIPARNITVIGFSFSFTECEKAQIAAASKFHSYVVAVETPQD
jgi:hypothetical protein